MKLHLRSVAAFTLTLTGAVVLVLLDKVRVPEPEPDFWADWAREVSECADAELEEMTS